MTVLDCVEDSLIDSDHDVKLLSSEIEMDSAVDSEVSSEAGIDDMLGSEEGLLSSVDTAELALSVEEEDSVETAEDALEVGVMAQPPSVNDNNKNKDRCFFFMPTFYRISLRQWIVFSWQDYMLTYLNDMIVEERQ